VRGHLRRQRDKEEGRGGAGRKGGNEERWVRTEKMRGEKRRTRNEE
jgi:hypothetical protein